MAVARAALPPPRLLLLLLLLLLAGSCSAQQTVLPGQTLPAQSTVQGEYLQYRTSIFTAEQLQLRVEVSTLSGDPALYVSDGQRNVDGASYRWFSDSLGERNEVVVVLVPASSSARTVHYSFAVGSTNGRARYAVGVYAAASGVQEVAAVQDDNNPAQASAQIVEQAPAGFYKLLRYLPRGFTLSRVEVELSGTGPEGQALAGSGPRELRVAGALSSALQHRLVSDAQPQQVLKTTTLATTVELLLAAPATDGGGGGELFLAASGDLAVPLQQGGPTGFAVRVQELDVSPTCIEIGEVYSGKLAPGEDQFYAVPLPPEGRLLRIEVLVGGFKGNLQVFLSDTHLFPTEEEQSLWSQVCRNCQYMLKPKGGVPGSPQAHKCGAEGSLGLGTRGYYTRETEYSLRVYTVDEHCGWRPDCTTCGAGGTQCTWCTTSGGFCDTVINEERERGAPLLELGDSCTQAVWCPAEETVCNSLKTCGECAAEPSCGWCGNAEEAGICTSGTDNGPNSGRCELWAFREPACEGRCAVHDGATEDGCSACTQEPDCGFCYNVNSGLCLPGTATSSEDGNCPGGGSLWSFLGDTCDAAQEDAAISLPLGEQTYQRMKIGENLLCAVGPCTETAFKVPLVEAELLNIQATLAVLPQDAVVRFTGREMRGGSSSASEVNPAGFIKGAESADVGALDLGLADTGGSFAEQVIIHSSCGRSLSDVSLLFKLTLESVRSREEVDAFFVASQVSSIIKLRLEDEMQTGADGNEVPSEPQRWLLCCNQPLHLRLDTSGLESGAGDAKSGEIRIYLKQDAAMPDIEILTKRSVCAYSYQKDNTFLMEIGRLFRNIPTFTENDDGQADGDQSELERIKMKQENEVEYISLPWEPGSGGYYLAFLSSSEAATELVIRDAVFYPENESGANVPPFVWGVVGAAIGLLIAGIALYVHRRRLRSRQYERQKSPHGTDEFMEMNASFDEAPQEYTTNEGSYVKAKKIEMQQSEMMSMLSKLQGRLESMETTISTKGVKGSDRRLAALEKALYRANSMIERTFKQQNDMTNGDEDDLHRSKSISVSEGSANRVHFGAKANDGEVGASVERIKEEEPSLEGKAKVPPSRTRRPSKMPSAESLSGSSLSGPSFVAGLGARRSSFDAGESITQEELEDVAWALMCPDGALVPVRAAETVRLGRGQHGISSKAVSRNQAEVVLSRIGVPCLTSTGKNPTAHKKGGENNAWEAVRTDETVLLAEGDLVCLALPGNRISTGEPAITFRVFARRKN